MPAGPASEKVGPAGASVGAGAAAVAAGVGLLAGLSLPLGAGFLPALAVGVCAIALVARRGPLDPERLAALPRAHRVALAALLLAPAIPLATVGARALAGLAVAFPASLWAAVPALGIACAGGTRVGSHRLALPLLVAATLAAGAVGARFEAAGAHARGETWSGPILGIHPFQTTAVLIDGYGPFDLPINDFVEPDGSKGYGPEALAAAIERDFHAIAAQQFAEHGPARAHAAFAGARVVAEELPEVRERLDRASERPTQPRLRFTSGGVGRRSRVEFVCPGALNDPRPRRPDAVMERMCPDKYTAEASAGLGLTGRWTGYVEVLGQPRLSLARALGWPRERVRQELQIWAFLALGLLGIAGWGRAGGAPLRLVRWGGALAAVVAVLAILFIVTGFSVQVPATGGGGASPWAVAPWIALLALGSGHAALAGPARPAAAGRMAVALPLVAGTLGLAGSLAAAVWIRPELAPPARPGDALPLEGLIAGLGEALHRETGIGLPDAEGIVAAAAAAVLIGLLAALVGPVTRFAGSALVPSRPVIGARVALAAVIVPAALLVLSRKTAGAALLLPPAAALAWMAGSGLALAIPGRPGRRWPGLLDHLCAAVLVGLAGLEVLAAHDNHMTRIALIVCAVVAAAGLVLLRRAPGAAGLGRVRSASDPGGRATGP
ncbi:MAG TPA: hypothetical protein VIK91_02940 [Nannocystis sp.]